jgi:hypothetical protein
LVFPYNSVLLVNDSMSVLTFSMYLFIIPHVPYNTDYPSTLLMVP